MLLGVFAGGIGEDPLGASMGLNGVGRPASGDDKDKEASKALFHKGELSFGVVLGFCTGYLIKKVGKLFALAVGAGFIFLQVRRTLVGSAMDPAGSTKRCW